MRANILLLILTLFLVTAAGQTRTGPSVNPEVAEIDRYSADLDHFVKRNQKSALIFADVAPADARSASWQKFKNERARDKADTGENLNENAYVWLRAGKVVAVNFTFQSPSRDWAHFVMYFYRADGTLAKIHSTLNTFYGDMTATRDQYFSREGKLLKTKKKFVDLKTHKPKKPDQFQDEPIPVFKTVSELPFHKLL